MTVAHIREPKGGEFVEIVFLESARFYRLLRQHPRYGSLLTLLRTALKQGRPVEVRLTSLDSDIIEDVQGY
jgi:hypothetical protein